MLVYIHDTVCLCIGEDWRSAMKKESSPLHLLRPTGLQIQLYKSVIKDDAYLPRLVSLSFFSLCQPSDHVNYVASYSYSYNSDFSNFCVYVYRVGSLNFYTNICLLAYYSLTLSNYSVRVEGTLPRFEVKLSDHQLSTLIKVSTLIRLI